MTREEHSNIISELRTTNDVGRQSELLQQLDNDYNEMLSTADEHTQTIERLENENKTLAKANNELWLERSKNVNNVNNDNNNVNNDDNSVDEPPKKISFDELDFD